MKMKTVKQRKHGETFLTKTRWKTSNKRKAEKSFFMWGKEKGYPYTLSYLGILNGFFIRLGFFLAADVMKVTREIVGWRFHKKR